MKNKFLLTLLTLVFLTVGCSKDDSSTGEPTGKISGKLFVKNGSKPVGGALIFVSGDNDKLYYTYTNSTGDFTLDAPVGDRKLHMQTGNGANFRTSLPVTIVKNQTLTIDPSLSRLDQIANMAYVTGVYDEIQDIVTGLGYTITPITNTDLTNYATLSQYDVVFLNCGAKGGFSSTAMDDNLANFVANGGSLYASDWAVAYLTGGSSNSPGCGQPGGFIPDDKLCSIDDGASTTIIGAQISYPNLETALGFTSLDIEYDLGSWQKITTYDPVYWDVLVTDPTTSAPLMIKTNHFNGGTLGNRVGEDDGWITICHTDDSGTPITLTIEASEFAEHEAHGDSVGPCESTTNSGTIYYTTFHNHASGNIGNSGLILEYVILNL